MPVIPHSAWAIRVAISTADTQQSPLQTRYPLDNAEKREDSVKDVGKLLDWIATRPKLDAKTVAVAGGSYGGYMVLASLVHFGDRLKCGLTWWGSATSSPSWSAPKPTGGICGGWSTATSAIRRCARS